ncbi:DNA-binding response regulator [Pimelobacter simplex]|uniref:Uncharacterized protein n=1 Tax=Nocardioides simplex TaxID=2045 RepID=A0A0J9X2A4_NOCSI|nr:LuxR C-terminal-related transcriptional regulator [Pimelobacter simplex]AIY18015.1 hypothetical protein KR76_16840 [Pimelobacter simplex]MCG8153600.1 DNA-binding response regulator [Pimelobacter simplex]GEB17066.1 hypothetical protein NSI01_53810 [Pimelobacter simplex]
MAEKLQSEPLSGACPMRITIIDEHTLLVDALALVLEGAGYMVAKVEPRRPEASMATVLAAGLQCGGRLVLLGTVPGCLDTDFVAPLTAAGAVVVILANGAEEHLWGAAIQQGAKDVLPRSCSLEELVTVTRRVRDGLPLMGPQRRGALMAAARAERREARAIHVRLGRLTRREMQVLGSLMSGQDVRTIARAHVVVEATVRSQIKSILSKLEVNSQISAVGAAHRVAWRLPEQ